MKTGRMEFFNYQKKFGFVKDEEGTSYYINGKSFAESTNLTKIRKLLKENALLAFEAEEGAKGLVAVQMQRAKES